MTTTSKWSIYIFHKVRRKCPHRLERIEHHIGNSSPRYREHILFWRLSDR